MAQPISLADMERMERTQHLAVEDYARIMLTMLQEQSPMDVKDLHKRCPDDVKGNPLLTSLNGVADNLTEKYFTKVHSQWKNIAFPPSLNDLALETSKRLRLFGLEHTRRLYSVISVERFAALTGLESDLPLALAFAIEAGFTHDKATNFITVIPLMPDASLEGFDWVSDLEGLGTISDTVMALSRPPNPTNDSLTRKIHDY